VTDDGGAPAARAGGPTAGLANARRLRTPWLAPSVLTYGPVNTGRLLPKGMHTFYRANRYLASARAEAGPLPGKTALAAGVGACYRPSRNLLTVDLTAQWARHLGVRLPQALLIYFRGSISNAIQRGAPVKANRPHAGLLR
jgi:hypothetical protein